MTYDITSVERDRDNGDLLMLGYWPADGDPRQSAGDSWEGGLGLTSQGPPGLGGGLEAARRQPTTNVDRGTGAQKEW